MLSANFLYPSDHAFSKEVKQQTIDMIKADLGQVDQIIYSLASPVRMHPETGVLHRSTLKPIGGTFTNKTVDFHTGNVSNVSIEPIWKISLLFLNACATKTKKFNTQKENCKEIYVYFTQSKDCLGLNFQTYYIRYGKNFKLNK